MRQDPSVEEDAIILGLEPLHAVLLLQLVLEADLAAAELTVHHAPTGAREVHVEVHAVDARARVVLDTEIDVLGDAEAEAPVLGEVLLPELVLLHLEALLEDLLRLLAADGDVASDLLIAAHPEGADREPGLREHRLLLGELLQHLRGTGEAIAALAHTDVQDELLHLDLPHGIVRLVRHARE